MTFTMPVAVRYLEVDAQGVVFNSWYLAWFDEAMAAFLAHGGLPYQAMMDAGYDVQLVRSEIDWTSGLGFGDRSRSRCPPRGSGGPASRWTSRCAGTAPRSPARPAPSTW